MEVPGLGLLEEPNLGLAEAPGLGLPEAPGLGLPEVSAGEPAQNGSPLHANSLSIRSIWQNRQSARAEGS